MNDDFRRFQRRVVFFGMTVVFVILALVVWGSLEVRKLNSTLASYPIPPAVIRGIDGKDGANGSDGLSIVGSIGPAGTNGQSITSDQIAAAVAVYLNSNPSVGLQGATGAAGEKAPVLQVKLDPGTCQLQFKYDADDFWGFLAQLPTPCLPTQ